MFWENHICNIKNCSSMILSEECVISSVLSHHNKNLKQQTSITALGQTVSQLSDRSVLQLCVTAQIYLENKGKYIKIHPWGVRACWPKDSKKRERDPGPFDSSFYTSFFLSLGLPYVNCQECCLFYLRSSLPSSDLPLFYLHRLFHSLSFSLHHSGLLFPILTT